VGGSEWDRDTPAGDAAESSAGLTAWRARTVPRDPAERAVHQAVLQSFAATGRPPARAALARAAEAHGATAEAVLASLHNADVIRLDPARQVRVAYPFSAVPTRHRVQLAGGVEVWAMCAIDALGMPAMLGVDAVITSADPGSGGLVTVTIGDGRSSWHPATAVVFMSAAAGNGPSADFSCADINFFTSEASAVSWVRANPQLRGEVLDAAAAQRLGQQVFGALLDGVR
jgi:hypothetical protein